MTASISDSSPPERPPAIGFFTSSIADNRAAAIRMAHLKKTLPRQFKLFVLPGVTKGSAELRQYQHVRNLMVRAMSHMNAPIDIAIIADDDFDAAPDLHASLVRTVAALPSGWRTLHLCPGWRWGRERRNTLRYKFKRLLTSWGWVGWEFGLTPYSLWESEFRLDERSNGRFINNVGELARKKRIHNLGGPIAFAARREALPGIIAEYDAAWKRSGGSIHNDKLLLNMSAVHTATGQQEEVDFVAHKPILCIESERGGSFYPRKSLDPIGKMMERERLRREALADGVKELPKRE